jgi:predicted metalloendopeptidase
MDFYNYVNKKWKKKIKKKSYSNFNKVQNKLDKNIIKIIEYNYNDETIDIINKYN